MQQPVHERAQPASIEQLGLRAPADADQVRAAANTFYDNGTLLGRCRGKEQLVVLPPAWARIVQGVVPYRGWRDQRQQAVG